MSYNLGAGLQKDSLCSVIFNKRNEAYAKTDLDSAVRNRKPSTCRTPASLKQTFKNLRFWIMPISDITLKFCRLSANKLILRLWAWKSIKIKIPD